MLTSILFHCRNVKGNNVNLYTLSGMSSFNPKAMTYFIVHGWNSGKDAKWFVKMKDALLKRVTNIYMSSEH